jgi:hypothetical protein
VKTEVESGGSKLYPDNMNREEGFSMGRSWKPLIQTLNE